MVQQQCLHKYTVGQRKGERCALKSKFGKYCHIHVTQHKDESDYDTSSEEDDTEEYIESESEEVEEQSDEESESSESEAEETLKEMLARHKREIKSLSKRK
jgi:predicted DsbA family dithiol-disulfide isomerase